MCIFLARGGPCRVPSPTSRFGLSTRSSTHSCTLLTPVRSSPSIASSTLFLIQCRQHSTLPRKRLSLSPSLSSGSSSRSLSFGAFRAIIYDAFTCHTLSPSAFNHAFRSRNDATGVCLCIIVPNIDCRAPWSVLALAAVPQLFLEHLGLCLLTWKPASEDLTIWGGSITPPSALLTTRVPIVSPFHCEGTLVNPWISLSGHEA